MKHIPKRQTNLRTHNSVFIRNVFSYYKKHGRHDLLWRKHISPYKILVSELMLQQTQVSRVLPKFALWMKQYPTLAKLSKAQLKDILILWQGLGYQRRAKALYDISRLVSTIPRTHSLLCDLPGIGTYTASAMCAFAYDTFSHPMLETNIRTALIEHFHPRKNKISDEVLYRDLKRLEQYSLVKNKGARMWYFALMDYGAHLKRLKISHNQKSIHYTKQTPYKGSTRELRAKILFAVTHAQKLPSDARTNTIVKTLLREGYIVKKGKGYDII
jgi:A/G-specific adenine glycosylase